MSMTREQWVDRKSATMVSSTMDTEQLVSYDKCMDSIYAMINKTYIDNEETVNAMTQSELSVYNRELISSYVSDKKPLVMGFIKDQKAEFSRLIAVLQDDIINMGPLTDALHDEAISELQINDYKSIYAEQSGVTRLLTNKLTGEAVMFKSADDALKICNKLLKLSDVTLSRVGAIQGGMTADGFRVAAVHSSATAPDKGEFRLKDRSPAAVIRKFSKNPYDLDDLIAFKSMSTQMGEYIRCIPRASQTTIVAGATGSGKTVLLQAFTEERPKEKRTFIIEDQSELNARQRNEQGIDQSNTVQFEAREAPPGSKVGMSFPSYVNLIMQALRMSPRLFILGEIRTNEVINQAVVAANTGHPFYTTIHAEDVEDTITRIAQAVSAETPSVPYDIILDTICKNVTFIISQQKLDDGTRKLLQLAEITGTKVVEGKTVPRINMLFEFIGDGEGVDAEGFIHGDYYQVGRISETLRKKLTLKKLTKHELEILSGGPKEGEPHIRGTFTPLSERTIN